jgi:AraC-like DNA-binding protein
MGRVYHRHFHTNYELLLVITGNVHYNIDGEQYILKPYDLLLIPASTYHFVIPVSNAPYENYVLNFSPKIIDPEQQVLFAQPRVINIASELLLHRMFGLLDSYSAMYSNENLEKAARYLLGEILLYISHALQRRTYPKPITDSNPAISRIVCYINDNLQLDLNADMIAQNVGFSRSYVQNLFSQYMEIGLQQYINQKKIHAAHYDIQKGMSPGAAAAKYGYRNYSSFFRQYKTVFGKPPKTGRHTNLGGI